MRRKLAFVLGGGGARGALQVGALQALLEAGYRPDLLVGTSAGAINATYLAIKGVTLDSLEGLSGAWSDARTSNLLPTNYLWLSMRALLFRSNEPGSHRMQEFFIHHGLNPELKFSDIHDVQLLLVVTDLNSRSTILYGEDPNQSVLEGLLASTAIPPWVMPIEKDGRLLIDGGATSCLPIEPALKMGAKEIVALDLIDKHDVSAELPGVGQFVLKLLSTVQHRQGELEVALAESQGVKVRRIVLQASEPVPMWDFGHTDELIEQGYAIARQAIVNWQAERRSIWSRLRLSL